MKYDVQNLKTVVALWSYIVYLTNCEVSSTLVNSRLALINYNFILRLMMQNRFEGNAVAEEKKKKTIC